MARDCNTCEPLQGDECYHYTGPSYLDFDLVSGTWYKIADLLTKYTLIINSSTTTTTTTVI